MSDSVVKSPTTLVLDYMRSKGVDPASGGFSQKLRAVLEESARNPDLIPGLRSDRPATDAEDQAAMLDKATGTRRALPVPPIPSQEQTAGPIDRRGTEGDPQTSAPPGTNTPPAPGVPAAPTVPSPPNTSVYGTGGGSASATGPTAAEDWERFIANLPPSAPTPPAPPPQNTAVFGTGGGGQSTIDMLAPIVRSIFAQTPVPPGFIAPNASAFDLNRTPPPVVQPPVVRPPVAAPAPPLTAALDRAVGQVQRPPTQTPDSPVDDRGRFYDPKTQRWYPTAQR